MADEEKFLEYLKRATADLRNTFARVRRLLAPGGLLAMFEVTSPQRSFDLTVGLTEGWWAFTDTGLRSGSALLSRNQWLQLLPECGFESVATLPPEPSSRTASSSGLVVLYCSLHF